MEPRPNDRSQSREARPRGAVAPVPIEPAVLPPRATADGTHRKLLEVALAGFAERGYHGLSIREIAKAAGIKASSVYAHLESKEQLLKSLVLLGHVEHQDALRGAVLDSGADPVEQMRSVVRAHVRFHATYPMLALVANNELHALSAESLAEVMAVRQGSQDVLTDIIGRGVALGAFDCRQPWLASAAIGGMGIRVASWYRPGVEFGVEEVADAYADYAVRMLTGETPVSRPGSPATSRRHRAR